MPRASHRWPPSIVLWVALAACGSSTAAPAAPIAAAPVAPSVRARIESTLTSGRWRSGYSGSTVWIWRTVELTAPDRVEQRDGHTPLGARGASADTDYSAQLGTYRITDTGAVEIAIGGTTTRSTFVAAPDGRGGRLWAHTGYVAIGADGRRFRHERASRDAAGDGAEAECEIELSAPLAELDDATCRITVRVRARTFEGGHEKASSALDVEGRCAIDRSGALPRLSFEGFEHTDPVQATAEWSNWLARTGRSDPSAPPALHDAFRAAFVPVLAYDPADPDAVFAAYVSGPTLEPPTVEAPH